MKARLIVHQSSDWVLPSSGDIGPSAEPSMVHPCLWPADRPIPEGWEAIELNAEPRFRGTHLVRGQAGDLGVCGHPRGSHDRHSGQCLVEDCSCLRFREAG